MIEKYLTRYGVTFITDAGSVHTAADYGLYPVAWPDIQAAEVKTSFVDIPGANGSLDLTEAMTGFPTYKTRKASFAYLIPDQSLWDATNTRIRTDLHGKQARIITDEDPGYYYAGRVFVEKFDATKTNPVLTITAILDPYKYDITATNEDWLWDPFSFETGVIRDYGNISVTTTKTVAVVSSPMGGCPVFTFTGHGVDDAGAGTMTMTYDGETYNLALGENVFPEIELPHEQTEVTFTFEFSMVSGGGRFGTVSIAFQGGML